MTWYAHEIICQPTPEVLTTLFAHPVLSQGVYWVRDLEEHTWWKPEHQHGLPQSGLIVVRPVCSPSNLESWYASEVKYQQIEHQVPTVLSWYEVTPSGQVIEMAQSEKAALHGPPQALRQYLQHLSEVTSTVVAFYQCEMWGGTVDWETAWVYSPAEQVYDHPANSPLASEPMPQHDHEPLIAMVRHFGLALPTTYFAPHTRRFPWARYKITAP